MVAGSPSSIFYFAVWAGEGETRQSEAGGVHPLPPGNMVSIAGAFAEQKEPHAQPTDSRVNGAIFFHKGRNWSQGGWCSCPCGPGPGEVLPARPLVSELQPQLPAILAPPGTAFWTLTSEESLGGGALNQGCHDLTTNVTLCEVERKVDASCVWRLMREPGPPGSHTLWSEQHLT